MLGIIPPGFFFGVLVLPEFLNYMKLFGCIILWVVYIVLYVVVIASHFKTAFTDPGIIPRTPKKEKGEKDDPFFKYSPPQYKQVVVLESKFSVRWCDTCNMYRPPRAVHCSICDNCVYRFDHHCPWVGNCVGKRNYRFFLIFIFTTTLLSLYIVGLSIVDLVIRTATNGIGVQNFVKTLEQNPFGVVFILYGLIVFGFVGSLTFFHLSLISDGETTYEHIKQVYTTNPYHVSFWGNLKNILCSPYYPQYVNFKKHLNLDENEFEYEGLA
jgi:palmitoyltransferase ZDHHC9/14/18